MKLIDTSSWIEFLRGRKSEPSFRVRDLLSRGEAAWCEMTKVELWNGARGKVEKNVLSELEKELKLCSIDGGVWKQAQTLAQKCRDKGITAPSADIIIAACASQNGLELEHCDAHFEKIMPLVKKQ